MAAAPKTVASQIKAADKTQVELVRLSDGQRVKMPGGTWAALDDGRRSMGDAADWVRDSDKQGFERYTEPPGPAWKGVDLSRPTGIRTPSVGSFGGGRVVLLAAIPPGTQCLVQTGQWQAERKREGHTSTEFARADRFVTAGVRPGVDTRNWLNQEAPGFWLKRDAWPAPLMPTFELSPYRIGVASKAPQHRDTVLAVVGIPKPGSKDTILELPGDATCVPVGYAVMRQLGYPARLQPLDTPGFVRLSTDAGAVLGNVWLVGDVGMDQPRMEQLHGSPEGKLHRISPRENHRMPCPRTGPLYTPGGKEFNECYKQGIAAYIPGFNGDEGLDGPVVLLMPGAKGIDWPKTGAYGQKTSIDEPGYWIDSPVAW